MAQPRGLLNLQHYGNAWTVHFIDADCRTIIGPRTRYYTFRHSGTASAAS
jgi:hypothetical protein